MLQSSRFHTLLVWLFSSNASPPSRLLPRWLFLRALGLIFFSAFYSFLRQALGLIGPDGLLPAGDYLRSVAQYSTAWNWWYVPTLFWFRSGSQALLFMCWLGIVASLLLVVNFWPRASRLV